MREKTRRRSPRPSSVAPQEGCGTQRARSTFFGRGHRAYPFLSGSTSTKEEDKECRDCRMPCFDGTIGQGGCACQWKAGRVPRHGGRKRLAAFTRSHAVRFPALGAGNCIACTAILWSLATIPCAFPPAFGQLLASRGALESAPAVSRARAEREPYLVRSKAEGELRRPPRRGVTDVSPRQG